MMQVCSCTVRLAGKIEQERTGKIATAAEIQVLKYIHGADAVFNVTPLNTTNRSNAVELDRLKSDYSQKVVEAVFPGFAPTLPATLKDIGLDTPSQAKALRAKAARDIEMAELLEKSGDGSVVVDAGIPAPPTEDERFDNDAGYEPKTKEDIFGLGAAA